MDAVVVIILIIILGYKKVTVVDSNVAFVPEISGADDNVAVAASIPIGKNLMLKYEPDAFERIIRDLGLRK